MRSQDYALRLAQTGRFRMDAVETMFLARALTEVEATIYKIKYPEFLGRQLVPMRQMSSGYKFGSYQMQQEYGTAKIIANYADDLPMVGESRSETTFQIRDIADAYGYSISDLEHAARAGVSLDMEKAQTARRVMEQKIDFLLQTGDVAYNMLGLLNQTGTNTYTVPNGGGGSPLWINKTSDEILADLNGIAKKAWEQTNGVERSTRILLPLANYELIATKPRSTTSDTTVLDFFVGTSQFVRSRDQVVAWWPCATAGAGSGTRMVAYRPEEEAVFYSMPKDFTALPPQERNLMFVIPCVAQFGGVHLRYPKSMTYGDGI